MSKRWNMSQQAQEDRDCFKVDVRNDDIVDDAFVPYQEQKRIRKKKSGSASKIFLALIFLSLVGLNAQLFLLAQKYVVKIDTIDGKIDDVQRSLALNKTEINGVSNNMVSLRSRQEALETEFVDIKDKFIALSEKMAKPTEVVSLEQAVDELSNKIAELIRSDAKQHETIETLEKKKDSLVRRFALYDAELKRINGLQEKR